MLLAATACANTITAHFQRQSSHARPSAARLSLFRPSSARLEAVAFANPRNGLGLFTLTRGQTCQGAVAPTSDGGGRFARPHAAINWPCSGNAPVTSLAADTSGDVFAFGPALVVSHDHGKSWARVRPGGAVLAVAAQGKGRSAWLLTAGCPGPGSRPDSCPLRLLVSRNGGRSWQPARAQLPGAALAGFGAQVTGHADLVRTSGPAAYVLASPGPNAHGNPDTGTLWTTRDSGASWSRRPVRCGLDALSDSLAVAPGGTIFVACAGEPGVGSQNKTLARSANGGRTWTVRTPCRHSEFACPPLSFGYLGQIAATPDGRVFLAGPRSSLLVTRDSGRSWHLVRPVIGDQGGGTTQVVFFGSRGIVLGSDPANDELPAIWHTSDSGTHWHVTHPSAG